MALYRYAECGLGHVFVEGIFRDPGAGGAVAIPNVNRLHRMIAQSLVALRRVICGEELRFLRTELGLSRDALAALLSRAPEDVASWERNERRIDAAADLLVRQVASEALLDAAPLDATPRSAETAAIAKAITIRLTESGDYRLAGAGGDDAEPR